MLYGDDRVSLMLLFLWNGNIYHFEKGGGASSSLFNVGPLEFEHYVRNLVDFQLWFVDDRVLQLA